MCTGAKTRWGRQLISWAAASSPRCRCRCCWVRTLARPRPASAAWLCSRSSCSGPPASSPSAAPAPRPGPSSFPPTLGRSSHPAAPTWMCPGSLSEPVCSPARHLLNSRGSGWPVRSCLWRQRSSRSVRDFRSSCRNSWGLAFRLTMMFFNNAFEK